MRESTAPTERECPKPLDGTIASHPAFGCVVVTHWNSNVGHRLFGSDLGHRSGITLSFHEAEMHRRLSGDRHHCGKEILSVDISESQWSRIIASTGDGNGVPVTIRESRDGKLQILPAIAAPKASKKEVHGEEMRDALSEKLETMRVMSDSIRKLLDSPGSVSKTELRKIHEQLDRAVDHLPGSIKFVYDQFAEATEQVAEDAKIEIDAHLNRIVAHAGLESLRQSAPRLTDERDTGIQENSNVG